MSKMRGAEIVMLVLKSGGELLVSIDHTVCYPDIPNL